MKTPLLRKCLKKTRSKTDYSGGAEATLCAWALLCVLLLTSAQLPAQTFKVIHNFTNNPNRANPRGGLVLGVSTLYGTTYNGGIV